MGEIWFSVDAGDGSEPERFAVYYQRLGVYDGAGLMMRFKRVYVRVGLSEAEVEGFVRVVGQNPRMGLEAGDEAWEDMVVVPGSLPW